ncbi:group I intron-associated PD-(D/E)XK endonuclease [uncultured Jatrophihabitans sp.]|uniref:group I intron-associated PD-(D/E)XK endonuclease n=1 Tax=uncultured Jatrophihabitans sp. TaxID=1610747 RepID=UPI0035CC9557
MYERTYSDDDLARAVLSAHSWRGVLRALGLRATSAGSARSVRRHTERLGLSYAHFTGQRRWSDGALRAAVATAGSWSQVATALGLVADGGTLTALRAHAHRLGLPTDHLNKRPLPVPAEPLIDEHFRTERLRDAGSLFAATWFALRGAKIAWPLEPCRYDLVVDGQGGWQRIQVKTTERCGSKAVLLLSNSRKSGRSVYAPGEIDSFFAIDGELSAYLVPYDLIAGYTAIQLGRYANYRIVDRGRMMPGS